MCLLSVVDAVVVDEGEGGVAVVGGSVVAPASVPETRPNPSALLPPSPSEICPWMMKLVLFLGQSNPRIFQTHSLALIPMTHFLALLLFFHQQQEM